MIKPNKITKPDSKAFIKNLVTNHNYVFSLVVMTIIGFIANPNFLRFTNIMTLMKSASILGVLALGMTLVILIGQIDLSVGSNAGSDRCSGSGCL